MIRRCTLCRKVIPTISEESEKNPYHPFCSERCKLVDLNAWLDAEYRVTSPLESHEHDDPD